MTLLAIAQAGVYVEEDEIVSDSLWTLSYILDTEEDTLIESVATTELIAQICQCLISKDLTVYVPGLRCIGNILTSNDERVMERCLFNSVIEKLTSILF